MGYIRHHAIVVTAYDDGIKSLHEKASGLFDWVSPISPSMMNGYRSFFIPPDGSKEGWDFSEKNDGKRKEFVCWLRQQYNLGNYCDWVEVQYGDDEKIARVVNHSDDVESELLKDE